MCCMLLGAWPRSRTKQLASSRRVAELMKVSSRMTYLRASLAYITHVRLIFKNFNEC